MKLVKTTFEDKQNQKEKDRQKLIKLNTLEKKAVEEAKKKGFSNPLEHEDDVKAFKFGWHDKKIRRFIVDFGFIDSSILIQDEQCKKEMYDLEWVSETLIPQIRDFGGLEYPIGVCEYGEQKRQQYGFNRTQAFKTLYPSEKIPYFLMSEPFYIDKNGQLQTIEPSKTKFYRSISRTKSNPGQRTNPYKMEDVIMQLKDGHDADPSWGGLNPKGTIPKGVHDQAFKDIMDELHPNQFRHNSTRGTILKGWKNSGITTNKIIPVNSKDAKTADLVTIGWDPGVNGNGAMEAFTKHIDVKNRALIGCLSSAGRDFERDVSYALIGKALDEDINENADKVFLRVELKNPSTNFATLDTNREEFLSSRIALHNEKAMKLNEMIQTGFSYNLIPLVEKVCFPKQLHDPNNKLTVYSWDNKNKKFVKEKTY